jgi:hypothetical protein
LIFWRPCDFDRCTKTPCYDSRDSFFSTISARSPFFLHSFRFGSEVHLDESSLTAGSVVYSSDLRSALEEFFISVGKGLFGVLFPVFGTASTRCLVWGLGELGSGCYIPVLAFNWGVLGRGMDKDWRLGLYEMRFELPKFYIRCKNDASSLAALRFA